MAFKVSSMDFSLRFFTEVLGLRLHFRHLNLIEQEDYAFLELEGGNNEAF